MELLGSFIWWILLFLIFLAFITALRIDLLRKTKAPTERRPEEALGESVSKGRSFRPTKKMVASLVLGVVAVIVTIVAALFGQRAYPGSLRFLDWVFLVVVLVVYFCFVSGVWLVILWVLDVIRHWGNRVISGGKDT